MIYKIIFLSIGLSLSLNATIMAEGEFYKEKQELIVLKKELNDFYEKKEAKYQVQKQEIDQILAEIKAQKAEIEKIKNINKKQIDDVNQQVTSRAIKMYDKMKVKVVLDIFNKMIADGNMDEVFDVMIKLKEKRVMEILKKISIDSKTILMTRFRNYNFKDNIKEDTKQIVSPTIIKMYNKMKVKVVLDIFNKMIAEGNINEVFDIIIKLKEKRTMEILKKIDVDSKTILMERLKKYNFDKNKKDN